MASGGAPKRRFQRAGPAASLGLAARPKTCCSSTSCSADARGRLGACQTHAAVEWRRDVGAREPARLPHLNFGTL